MFIVDRFNLFAHCCQGSLRWLDTSDDAILDERCLGGDERWKPEMDCSEKIGERELEIWVSRF